MLAPDFLKILRCPDDRSTLVEADAETLSALNAAVAGRRLRNRGGEIVERRFDGGLVRSDGAFVYPVIDGIPVMLVDEAVPLASLKDLAKPDGRKS